MEKGTVGSPIQVNLQGDTYHICVCICTYKRERLLEHLLVKLQSQRTEDLFTYSIVVVDNDHDLSAQRVVEDLAARSRIKIDYYVEPVKHVALARNKAVLNAQGDFVALIDDDEWPVEDWLLHLYRAYRKYNPDGVLGPVREHFEEDPPKWIIRAKLWERKTYSTGHTLHWEETKTGNCLLRKSIFHDHRNLFDPRFAHGEDKDFFRRMMSKGLKFIWSNEALVYETCLPDRFKKSFYLKRALLRGSISFRHRHYNYLMIVRSVIGCSVYTLSLPILLLFSFSQFMKYLIRDCDHIGRLLMAYGIDIGKYL